MKDERFVRGSVPMTKSEIRAVTLSKLELEKDSVVYDIGAGTGSVSIEAAMTVHQGLVYAIEQKEEAVNLIEQNKDKFHAENLTVVHGTAPDALEHLRKPTHAFIGGSSGHLYPIVKLLLLKNPSIRIVINIIALESLSQVLDCLKKLNLVADIVSVQVARSNQAGGYHMMQGQNPVYIVSFGGKVVEDETANP